MPDNNNRIYWCPAAGGYHVTRSGAAEYSRRQALKYHQQGEETEVETVQEQQQQNPGVIGRGGDCPTCGWLHGFHDPVLHSYHEVPAGLTWKPGQPAPWEEPPKATFDPFARQKMEIVNKNEELLCESKPLAVQVPVTVQDDISATLSVLPGLTADDVL